MYIGYPGDCTILYWHSAIRCPVLPVLHHPSARAPLPPQLMRVRPDARRLRTVRLADDPRQTTILWRCKISSYTMIRPRTGGKRKLPRLLKAKTEQTTKWALTSFGSPWSTTTSDESSTIDGGVHASAGGRGALRGTGEGRRDNPNHQPRANASLYIISFLRATKPVFSVHRNENSKLLRVADTYSGYQFNCISSWRSSTRFQSTENVCKFACFFPSVELSQKFIFLKCITKSAHIKIIIIACLYKF